MFRYSNLALAPPQRIFTHPVKAAMLVSIYMPTKNRAAMLQSAAASVLRQSYWELELIIVDDGSTDETPLVLADLALLDKRVRVLRNENSLGAPASRNCAIAAARGNWITGIDDDDSFEPGRIEALVSYWQLLERLGESCSGLYTQDYYVGKDIRTVSLKRGSVDWRSLFEYNVVGNQLFTLTERLRAVGGFDPAMPAWQDLDLFIRVLKQFGPSRLLDAPLYSTNVEDRADRISKSKKARLIDAYSRLIAKHPEVTGRELQLLYLQIFGKLYSHVPDLADARRFLKNGWNFWPIVRLVRAWSR